MWLWYWVVGWLWLRQWVVGGCDWVGCADGVGWVFRLLGLCLADLGLLGLGLLGLVVELARWDEEGSENEKRENFQQKIWGELKWNTALMVTSASLF